MFVASRCAFQDVTTPGIGGTSTSAFASASAPVSASASTISTRQSHRKGIASQPEHLHLNPGVHKSQATIESLGLPQYSSETFSAIRASRHRSKYSNASVRLEQTTQSHDRQNWRLDSIRPSILRTAFLSRGSKALERNTQPCPPSSHPSTRCSP